MMKHVGKMLFGFVLGVLVPAFALAQSGPPIRDVQGIITLANNVSRWVATVFWIVAVIAVFYAAFLFLRGGDDEEKLGKAKKQLWYAVIAIAVGLMAYGFVPLIDSALRGASGTGSPAVPDISNIPLDPNRGSNVPPLTPPLTPGGSLPSQPLVPPGGPVRDKDF